LGGKGRDWGPKKTRDKIKEGLQKKKQKKINTPSKNRQKMDKQRFEWGISTVKNTTW